MFIYPHCRLILLPPFRTQIIHDVESVDYELIKVFLEVLPTPKTAQLKQPGSKTATESQLSRPEGSPPAQAGQQSVTIPSNNSTPKRGFVKSVNKSPEVSPTVAGRAKGTYQPRSTAKLAESADKFASGNMSKAVERVSSALEGKAGSITDKNVADAIAVAKRLDSNKNHAQATDIINKNPVGQKLNSIPIGLSTKDVSGEPIKPNPNPPQGQFGPLHPELSASPQQAVDHLLKIKTGEVPAFMDKPGLGKIDLIYGKQGPSGYGLAHIASEKGKEFARQLPSVIDRGRVVFGDNRAFIISPDSKAIVPLDFNGIKNSGCRQLIPLIKVLHRLPRGEPPPTRSPLTDLKVLRLTLIYQKQGLKSISLMYRK